MISPTLLIAILGVLLGIILLIYSFLRIKTKRQHQITATRLSTCIDRHRTQMAARQQDLNSYDFTVYNLDQALKVRPIVICSA